MPSAARHTTPRGLSPKRLLEFIMPELNLHCLRLASNSPKVRDTLLKLDEQGVSRDTCWTLKTSACTSYLILSPFVNEMCRRTMCLQPNLEQLRHNKRVKINTQERVKTS